MAKQTLSDLATEAIDAFSAFVTAAATALENGEVAFTAPAKAEPGSYSRDELEEMDIKSLRDLAKRHSLDTIKKAEIIDALASEDEGEGEEDDEEYEEVEEADDEESDEEEEDDDEGEAYTREELEEMTLRNLRALAKESGFSADDIKGLDQDALIDLMLEEEDEDADEADEDDEDYEDDDESEEEGDEEEEDEDGEELTEDDLNAMNLAELKEVASDIGITVPRGVKKPALIDLILESADE